MQCCRITDAKTETGKNVVVGGTINLAQELGQDFALQNDHLLASCF